MSDLSLAWFLDRNPSLHLVEAKGPELVALARLAAGGRGLLMRDGKPVAALVGLEDLAFLLDADRDLAEAQMDEEAAPPPSSGKVRKFEH